MRFSAGDSYRNGWFILVIVLTVLSLGLTVLVVLLREWTAFIVCIGLNLFFTLLVVAVGLIVRTRICWLEIMENGFSIQSWRGKREFSDTQVQSMAYVAENSYANGLLKGIRHELILWLELNGEIVKQKLKHTGSPDDADPLAAFAGRLEDDLFLRVQNMLKTGGYVEGVGWRLSARELEITQPNRIESCFLTDIAAVNLADGKVCVWTNEAPEPKYAFPQKERNSMLLLRLLRDNLSKSKILPSTIAEGDLGRILFQRKIPKFGGMAAAVVILATGGLILINDLILAGTIVCTLSVFPLFYWGLSLNARFLCCERGVRLTGRLGVQTDLRFDEIESFTYSSVRHFYNGAYTGTRFELAFHPFPKIDKKKISYKATVMNADEELEKLRAHVSMLIADNLAKKLAEGEPISWTPQATFYPDYLECRRPKLLGKHEVRSIPYPQISGFSAEDGRFALFEKNQKKASFQCTVSERNFFPGLHLLESIMAKIGDEAERQNPEATEENDA